MKGLFLILVACICTMGLMSCGISLTATGNHATTLTNVQLSRNNFEVLGRVSGNATNWYLFGFGGLMATNLVGRAKNEMINNANLVGGAKAIVDVTYDTHIRTIFIFSEYKVTATGTVIEFFEYE